MIDLVKKAMLMGLGAASISADHARSLAEDLIGEGKMTRDEGEKFVREVTEKADASRKEWEEKLAARLRELDLPTPAYVKGLEERIKTLEEEVEKLKGS